MARARQTSLRELAGEREQAFGRGDEVIARDGAPPGVGPRAPVGRDASRDDETRLVVRPEVAQRLEAFLVEEPVGHVQLRLDVRLGARGADRGRVALRAEQEADRLGHDRLAGARLPRQRHETRIELEVRLTDQHEVLDPQSPQHVEIVDGRLAAHTWPLRPGQATSRSPRDSG